MSFNALDVRVVNLTTHLLEPEKNHYMNNMVDWEGTVSNGISYYIISPADPILNILSISRGEHRHIVVFLETSKRDSPVKN